MQRCRAPQCSGQWRPLHDLWGLTCTPPFPLCSEAVAEDGAPAEETEPKAEAPAEEVAEEEAAPAEPEIKVC